MCNWRRNSTWLTSAARPTQGKIDAALVANRAAVAGNFTALLDQPSEIAGYSGYAAATARAMLNAVNQNTSLLTYESNVLSTVERMSASHAVLVGVSSAEGSGWLTV